MEFIDADGAECKIPTALVEFFQASSAGKDLQEDIARDNRAVDFSKIGRSCLRGEYINAVLGYAQNLESLIKKKVDSKEVYHLDAANYLGLQQKEVLYHLANRVWGYLQTGKQRQDLLLSDHDEAYIRKVAKPYLNSPAKLRQECKKVFVATKKEDGSYFFNLSFKYLQDNYEQVYPFALSYGLPDFINTFVNNWRPSYSGEIIELNFSEHAIPEFVIDDWEREEPNAKSDQLHVITLCVNLANSGVQRIAWTKVSSNLRWQSLDLSHNPINFVDDSIYNLMHKYRSHAQQLSIRIPHHRMSEEQLAVLNAKAYLAVNTLVDRWFSKCNPMRINSALAWGSIIISSIKAYCAYRASDFKYAFLWCPGGVVVGSVGTSLVLGGKLIPFAVCKLAQITHPEIERSDNVICLPGNIWVASHINPLGNSVLSDDKKPQLILH